MPGVLQQQTISRPATFSGIGLHSGNRVNMNFLPAEPDGERGGIPTMTLRFAVTWR